MSGAGAKYGVWITSCTLKKDRLAEKPNYQWVSQQFGYHNSPSVGNDQPSEWFDSIAPYTNQGAWLDEMEDKPGVWTGDNSPIVVSYGRDSTQCYAVRANSMMVTQINVPRGGGPACGNNPPAFFYCYGIRDNGTSSSCP